MSVLSEIREKALGLSESERGQLAESLLESLAGHWVDDDGDGIEEAIRRAKDLEANPELGISLEELDRMIRQRFPECVP